MNALAMLLKCEKTGFKKSLFPHFFYYSNINKTEKNLMKKKKFLVRKNIV